MNLPGLCLLMLLMELKSTAGSEINRGHNEELMPTAAGLIDKDNPSKRVYCSGTILSENKILTAAHCVKREHHINTTQVLIKEDSKELIFDVRKIILHPYFNPDAKNQDGNMHWDIAILHLTENIDIVNSRFLKAAVLPPPEIRVLGRKVKVGGWRRSKSFDRFSDEHYVIDMTFLVHESCGEILREDNGKAFCTGGKSVALCYKFSGAGAVFYQDNLPILIGIASFGDHSICTWSPELAFQNVLKNLPWIFKETGLK